MLLVRANHVDEHISCDATAVHHSAEWGMRQFQASFPCMKNKFKFEVDGESLFCYVFLFICSIGKQILWVQPDKNFVYAMA